MKNMYRRAIEFAVAAVTSAAIGFGIGYEVGDSHGYERAPIDMEPGEFIRKRFEIRRERMMESLPKTDAELLEWYRDFKPQGGE